ncbi:hypothetical protein ABBQ38_003634 [Trebouxia sp. C0009 RCD-2024]
MQQSALGVIATITDVTPRQHLLPNQDMLSPLHDHFLCIMLEWGAIIGAIIGDGRHAT